MKKKTTILQCIGRIYEKSKQSRLEVQVARKMQGDLKLLAEYLQVSETQAFLAALIFSLNYYKNDSVDFSAIIEHLECNPLKMLEFSADIEVLKEKKIIRRIIQAKTLRLSMASDFYLFNDKLSDAIIKNKSYIHKKEEEVSTSAEFMERVYSLYEELNDSLLPEELLSQFTSLSERFSDSPLLVYLQSKSLTPEEMVLVFILIRKYTLGMNEEFLDQYLELMYPSRSIRAKETTAYIQGNKSVILSEIIEIGRQEMFNALPCSLSERFVDTIHSFGIQPVVKPKQEKYFIHPDKILDKQMQYPLELAPQIQQLENAMNDGLYKKIIQRLLENKMQPGITALLYGAPGTGKTESVLQLAKKSGRSIYQVDISQTRSMWFGESEKLIKKIFSDYRAALKTSKIAPILLFNEADAILSKRMDSGHSAAGQTENTIQNILLEELEKFEGIFFATTNLAQNFDAAFERRFLYKIKFVKPDLQTRALLWKEKLTHPLTEQEYFQLAKQYEFSGGEIENICRKCLMYELIEGKNPDYNQIHAFAELEKIALHSGSQIGFKTGQANTKIVL